METDRVTWLLAVDRDEATATVKLMEPGADAPVASQLIRTLQYSQLAVRESGRSQVATIMGDLAQSLGERDGVRFLALDGDARDLSLAHEPGRGGFGIRHRPGSPWAVLWRDATAWRDDVACIGQSVVEPASRLLAELETARLGRYTVELASVAELRTEALLMEALIVDPDGEPVAFAAFDLGPWNSSFELRVELSRLVVRPDRRRQGVAREVGAAWVDLLRVHGVPLMTTVRAGGGRLAASVGLGFRDLGTPARMLAQARETGRLEETPELAALSGAVEHREVGSPREFLEFGRAGRAVLSLSRWSAESIP